MVEQAGSLGGNIRRLRLRDGLTQEGLAFEIGVSHTQVSRWEKDHERPGRANLLALAKLFGVPIRQLTEAKPPLTQASKLLSAFNSVSRDECFTKAGLFRANPDRKCVGVCISVEIPRGAEGVPPASMELQELATRPALPLYIQKQLSRTKIGGADRDKVAVVDWMQQPDDVDDGKVTMHVSHSKYSTLLATRACQTQVLRDIAERKLRICDDAAYDDGNAPRLQCNLHCDGVVLSADQRIMIAERSKRTDAEQFLWTASFGEGMDWQRDRQLAGALHPERTVWRALKQELGLHEEWLKTRSSIATKVTLLEMGFSTHMQYILFSMVELPIDMDEALYRARNHRDDPAEQRSFSSMNFTVDECVSAVVDGHVEGKRLIDASRLGLWIACMHKF